MNVMTKRGSQDNVVTYEHYCDTKEDLTAIPNDQITLGSTAVVLKDEGDAMGVYMANSSKEWIPFSSIGNAGDGSGGGSTGGVMIVRQENNQLGGSQLDKTWQEIFDAMKSGMLVILNATVEDTLNTSSESKMITSVYASLGTYHVAYSDATTRYVFSTTSPDGYPEIDGGDGGVS